MSEQDRIPLTVVIPVRNEAGLITACVRHHARAAEVIVVDNGSTDATVNLARDAGARVLDLPGGTIAGQRNIGIDAATQEWVLAIDADERVSDALWAEIGRAVASPEASVWRVRRRNLYLGQEQRRGRWGRDWVVRLFRRAYRFGGSTAHPALETGAAVIGTLRAPLDHEPYRDLPHQLEKMNRYARWGAEDLWTQGRRANVLDLVGRPAWRFLRAYVVHGSWRDGRFGLVTAALGAYTAFLKYAHLWALEREAEQPAGGRTGESS